MGRTKLFSEMFHFRCAQYTGAYLLKGVNESTGVGGLVGWSLDDIQMRERNKF